MTPELLSASDEHRAPATPFRLRDFRRVVALAWPFRGKLALGFLLTLAFASLHTLSISGAFPVFKILLDEEGLRGWIDRTLAGERLGAAFAPAGNAAELELLRVYDDGPLAAAGIGKNDRLIANHGVTASQQFQEVANFPSEHNIHLNVESAKDPRTLTVRPRELDIHLRVLRWAASGITDDTQQHKVRTLIYVLAILVVTAILANVCRYFGEVLVAKAILLAMLGLREKLYDCVLRLPLTYYSNQSTSDIVTRFVQDIQEIQRGLITLFGKFLREPLRALFLLGAAFAMDWRITLAVTLAAPAAVAVFWWVGRSVKTANKLLLQAYGTMIGALTASLHNLRVVKAYTAEEEEGARLDKIDRGVFSQQLKLARLDAFVSPMMETVAAIAGSVIVVWLLSRVLNHELSVAKFATLGLTLSVLFDPLRKMSDVWVRIQRSAAGAERIFQVIDQPLEGAVADSAPTPITLGPLREAIEYRNVTFTYPGAKQPALRNVSVTIRSGETVALVGPNGSGKTTLAGMIPRLYDPGSGQIFYDGVDLRLADLRSLRRQIGLVSQEAVVFGGTPAENIAYGEATKPSRCTSGHKGTTESDGATKRRSDGGHQYRDRQEAGETGDKPGGTGSLSAGGQLGSAEPRADKLPVPPEWNGRVDEAARRAYADEFIRNIPGGYEARLGERGSTLSGGQRQRLAIARAVYRDAPILIFDEATSQIDSESELKIQTALREFATGRTTIIIAHRLSTIQYANRIIVMDAGRIIDQGTHAELFARCALYRTLCETQLVSEPEAPAPGPSEPVAEIEMQ